MKRLLYIVIFVSVLLIWSGCEVSQRNVTLSVSTEGTGRVITYPHTGLIPAGESILLIPKPGVGWVLDAWIKDGQILPTVDELAFTIEDNYAIKARFIQGSSSNTMLDYRLEADWSSYSKTDKMLRGSSTSSVDSEMREFSTDTTDSNFQTATYLSSVDSLIPRERAILIKYKQGFTPASRGFIQSIDWAESSSLELKLVGSQYERLVLDEDDYESIPTILQQLKNSEGVEFAEEDYIYSIHSVPNDPFLSYQWNLDMLNMPAVWDVTDGDESVIIAVVDTGVYFPLADLNETRFGQGFDFVNYTLNAFDDNGHGSHVTGTIAQSTNNSLGVAGMASNVKILPIKVLASDGYGYVSDIAQGIIFAVNNGADIINMSLGGSYSSLIDDACKYASDHGVLIVASTGNDGISSISYPAALSTVMSVGAVNRS